SLAQEVIAGKAISKDEALAILNTPNSEILPLLHAAYQIRHHYYGNKVKLNMIINAKSGHCSEDCGYCSQSMVSTAPVEKYPLLERKTILEGARKAKDLKAGTYCIVTSGKKPTNNEVDEVIEAIKEIKATMSINVCACLGLITPEQAKRIKEAGCDRFNHNINTTAEHYSKVASTHTYQDRLDTLNVIKEAGMSPCSGVIIGLGETEEQVVDMAFELKEVDPQSIPVNFLNPIPGTPMENLRDNSPMKSLKVLALFRFVNPTKEIRISGGREVNLNTLQPMGLFAANSIFVGDYLTTDGQLVSMDHQMIQDLGFEIEEVVE
ncbi:MAG TPA: biotin synthase BioB, partial [Paenibacillaceae bacterium]|nr:biotin synthase BioB [Paenibacillaceae bacterium]